MTFKTARLFFAMIFVCVTFTHEIAFAQNEPGTPVDLNDRTLSEDNIRLENSPPDDKSLKGLNASVVAPYVECTACMKDADATQSTSTDPVMKATGDAPVVVPPATQKKQVR